MITMLLLLATGVHAQVPATDWRFAHPDADIRASINVQTLLKSPMIATLKEQAPKETQAQINMGLAMPSSIDRVSISARQPDLQGAGLSQAGGIGVASTSDALVLISGSFDAQFLQSMLGAGGPQVKQVDPHTVLVGQGPSFTQALARLAGTAAAASKDDELEPSDLFIEGDLTRLSQQQGQPTPAPLQNVRRFSFGMNIGESVDFRLTLTAAEPSDVQLLIKTFHDAMAQAGTTPEMANMVAKAMDMRQDGAKLRVHFVPPPEMIKAAQEAASSGGDPTGSLASLQPLFNMLGMGGGTPAGPAATPAKSPEPPPSNGGKIMIYGLDDGPKEVKAPK
jgi:hypothetical protein